MASLLCTIFILPLDPLHELIKGGSLMCTGGSQKCIDGSHGVKYSDAEERQARQLIMHRNQEQYRNSLSKRKRNDPER